MRVFLSIALACLVSACDTPSAKVTQLQFGTSTTLATTGNLRLVTERPRPGPGGSLLPIVCTEPSPDYAVEFGRTGKAEADVSIEKKGTGKLSGDFTQTEKVTQLAGRSSAVLALRDGLYAACQAYANGVIGHDAYSMILSQYGTLLVALVAKPDGALDATAQKRATFSAMMVACISQHDQSRIPLTDNQLLTPTFCRQVLTRGLRFSTSPSL
ncbi:hypothetical protein [Methylorubrum sp. SB2]|uniref:hypothetical protein n=1 Tax=Methylorubrum subtropicum TaxID=3138812 RepID=UPI00313ECCE5